MSVKDKAYITAMHRGSLAVSRDRAMTKRKKLRILYFVLCVDSERMQELAADST